MSGIRAMAALLLLAANRQDAAPDHLPPYRPVTLHVKGQTPREAMRLLAEQTGLPIKLDTIPERPPMTIDLTGETPLQALQSLCRASTLGYFVEAAPDWRGRLRSPKLSGIRIHEVTPYGNRPNPVAWVRHYRIDAASFNESRQQGKNVFTYRVSIACAPGTRPHSASSLELTAAEDKEGRDLLPLFDPPVKGAWSTLGVGAMGCSRILTLRTKDADAPPIGRLAGRLTFRYPKEVQWIRFPGPAESVETTVKRTGYEFTLMKYAHDRGAHEFVLKLLRLDGEKLTVNDLEYGRPFDLREIELWTVGGKRLESSSYCASSGGSVAHMGFGMGGPADDPAAELRIPWAENFVEDVVDFELKGLTE